MRTIRTVEGGAEGLLMSGEGVSQPGVCIPPPNPAEQKSDKGRGNGKEWGGEGGPGQAATQSRAKAERKDTLLHA